MCCTHESPASAPRARASAGCSLRNVLSLSIVLLLQVVLQTQATSLSSLETWWSMANLVELPSGQIPRFPGCDRLKLQTSNQLKSCDEGSRIGMARMTVLARASLATKLECQKQFAGKRWNCSTLERGPLFGRHVLYNATRESSFVHTLMAASVAHESAKACSVGRLGRDCSCVQNREEELALADIVDKSEDIGKNVSYRWKHCDNNILYGLRMAKKFQSGPRPGVWDATRNAINAHNEKLGRALIREGFERAPHCKCHGITASCSVKVCWREVPNFREVGNEIYRLYKNAVRVKLRTEGNASRLVVVNDFADERPEQDASAHRLVYSSRSWSFCTAHPYLDIPGTTGRVCQKSGEDDESCANLCCTRGHQENTLVTKTPCLCQFVWCCSVKCQTCHNERSQSECN